MSYWADSAFLAAAGIPTVLYGAEGEGAHADTEWVSRSGTSTATTVLTQFAQDFCSEVVRTSALCAVARPRPTPIVAHQIDLFCMAQLIGRERSAAAPTADTCAPHIGSAATVRDGTCMPVYALAAAVRRPRRCRRTALTVITRVASTASITQVRIRSPVSAKWNPLLV